MPRLRDTGRLGNNRGALCIEATRAFPATHAVSQSYMEESGEGQRPRPRNNRRTMEPEALARHVVRRETSNSQDGPRQDQRPSWASSHPGSDAGRLIRAECAGEGARRRDSVADGTTLEFNPAVVGRQFRCDREGCRVSPQGRMSYPGCPPCGRTVWGRVSPGPFNYPNTHRPSHKSTGRRRKKRGRCDPDEVSAVFSAVAGAHLRTTLTQGLPESSIYHENGDCPIPVLPAWGGGATRALRRRIDSFAQSQRACITLARRGRAAGSGWVSSEMPRHFGGGEDLVHWKCEGNPAMVANMDAGGGQRVCGCGQELQAGMASTFLLPQLPESSRSFQRSKNRRGN